ncbi:hypothetical protein [Hymenobacter radiodurans]|uniref:hypothetical protein n=1 Tax=Hymenobacter radiodurans TaxID=2496028 RepID=UPI0010588B28|nr:hypothetical protein [Hymenobacter radiodurans]
MMIRPLDNFVAVAGEPRNEDTKSWALLTEKPALYSLLQSVPVLAFSQTGVVNLSRRFHITAAELEGCIVAVLGENLRQSRPEWNAQDLAQVTKPTPELLETIRKAVTPKPRRKSITKAKKAGEGYQRA